MTTNQQFRHLCVLCNFCFQSFAFPSRVACLAPEVMAAAELPCGLYLCTAIYCLCYFLFFCLCFRCARETHKCAQVKLLQKCARLPCIVLWHMMAIILSKNYREISCVNFLSAKITNKYSDISMSMIVFSNALPPSNLLALTHQPTSHSLTHPLTHSLTHPLTHSLTHSLTIHQTHVRALATKDSIKQETRSLSTMMARLRPGMNTTMGKLTAIYA